MPSSVGEEKQIDALLHCAARRGEGYCCVSVCVSVCVCPNTKVTGEFCSLINALRDGNATRETCDLTHVCILTSPPNPSLTPARTPALMRGEAGLVPQMTRKDNRKSINDCVFQLLLVFALEGLCSPRSIGRLMKRFSSCINPTIFSLT